MLVKCFVDYDYEVKSFITEVTTVGEMNLLSQIVDNYEYVVSKEDINRKRPNIPQCKKEKIR